MASTPTHSRTRPERRVDAPFLSRHPEGVVVDCWVVPGASRSETKGVHGDSLRIRVSAPPEGGRANREVCRLLEEATGARAELLSGSTSRRKKILLRDADIGRVEERLSVE